MLAREMLVSLVTAWCKKGLMLAARKGHLLTCGLLLDAGHFWQDQMPDRLDDAQGSALMRIADQHSRRKHLVSALLCFGAGSGMEDTFIKRAGFDAQGSWIGTVYWAELIVRISMLSLAAILAFGCCLMCKLAASLLLRVLLA